MLTCIMTILLTENQFRKLDQHQNSVRILASRVYERTAHEAGEVASANPWFQIESTPREYSEGRGRIGLYDIGSKDTGRPPGKVRTER